MTTPSPFAKLFDTAHGQLLVTTDGTDDDDLFPLNMRAAGNGVAIPSMANKYETADEQRAAFDAFDQQTADDVARSLTGFADRLLGSAS